MKKPAVALSVLMILSGVLAGCAQAQPSGTSNGPISGASAVAAKDLCALMSPSDVSGILGYTVEAEKGILPAGPTIASCNYINRETANGVTIIANYTNEYNSAADQYKQTEDFLLEDTTNMTLNPELNNVVGEKSFGWTSGGMTQFNVLKGNVWITLTLSGSDQEGRISQAKTVAAKAFSVL